MVLVFILNNSMSYHFRISALFRRGALCNCSCMVLLSPLGHLSCLSMWPSFPDNLRSIFSRETHKNARRLQRFFL